MRDHDDHSDVLGRLASGALAVLVLVFAVIAAAVAGPWEIRDPLGDAGLSAPDGFEQVAPEESTPSPAEIDAVPEEDPNSRLGAFSLIFLIALAAAIAILLALRFLLNAPLSPRYPHGSAVSDERSEPELPVLRRGLDSARRRLEVGEEAGNAIIAAWLTLEEAAKASGMRRRAAQTPTEFTTMVLNRTAADPAATTSLLRLYHKARFGSRNPTQDDLAEAASCLAAIDKSWDSVTLEVATKWHFE